MMWVVNCLVELRVYMFRIGSGVRQEYIMSPWLFNVYMDAFMKEVKMGMVRRGVRFLKVGKEWRLPVLLYADYLVICGDQRRT